MQNAKDTFYLALRNRLATLNPQRTITLLGTTRPGILVEEDEMPVAMLPGDVFVLRWTGAAVQTQLPAALQQLTCELRYWSRGTDNNLDMDRGRALTQMDAELAALLQPQSAAKLTVAAATDTQLATSIFWTDATFAPLQRDGERLVRSATVQVFALQEQLPGNTQEL